MKKVFLLAMLITCIGFSNSYAAEHETPDFVIKKVHKTVDLIHKHGEKALTMMQDKKSEFSQGDSYIFIMDIENGVALFNAAFPDRVGGNIR